MKGKNLVITMKSGRTVLYSPKEYDKAYWMSGDQFCFVMKDKATIGIYALDSVESIEYKDPYED